MAVEQIMVYRCLILPFLPRSPSFSRALGLDFWSPSWSPPHIAHVISACDPPAPWPSFSELRWWKVRALPVNLLCSIYFPALTSLSVCILFSYFCPLFLIFFKFIFCLFGFFFFRAAPVTRGGSQAKGQIRAVGAGLHHSHSNGASEPHLQPTLQLTAHRILNPLSEARDRAYVLMDASQIHFCWASMGTPQVYLLNFY